MKTVTGLVMVLDPPVIVSSKTVLKSTVVKTLLNDVTKSATDPVFAAT